MAGVLLGLGCAALLPTAAMANDRATSPEATTPTYTLVTEPSQGLTSIYNLITSAKKTIDMTMYELSDTTVTKLLAQEVTEGVKVRVILDQNLEKSNNTTAYNYLNSHGVTVHWANTKYQATHQKTITVDGATTAIMTLNLTPQYYSTSRDFAIIENDANDIAAIEATFAKDLTNSTVTPGDGDDLVWSPTNSLSSLESIIDNAKYTLQVENEEMGDSSIVSALEAAAKRGVNVEIMMTYNSDYASELTALKKAGCHIVTYASTASLYIHAKVVLADYNKTTANVFVGSENFSNPSLTENRELGVIIANKTIMTSLNTTLTSDYKGGTAY
ncbi:MAG TPA: phospholipase D-like domain-containing protein [Xanthomonadaceae bacterium]|nr:phospholipase D-like domain-containing protein [Xanthomonadaceae bacterium]